MKKGIKTKLEVLTFAGKKHVIHVIIQEPFRSWLVVFWISKWIQSLPDSLTKPFTASLFLQHQLLSVDYSSKYHHLTKENRRFKD
jgi:hypothetical protein